MKSSWNGSSTFSPDTQNFVCHFFLVAIYFFIHLKQTEIQASKLIIYIYGKSGSEEGTCVTQNFCVKCVSTNTYGI